MLDVNGVATWLCILALSFVQNIAFSLTSRTRNRDNFAYHALAATGSNVVWFLTFRALITADMTLALLLPYTLGTVAGSLMGASISMRLEQWFGATSDGHLRERRGEP